MGGRLARMGAAVRRVFSRRAASPGGGRSSGT